MASTSQLINSSIWSVSIGTDGQGTVGANISGTWSGTTLLVQVTNDNVNFTAIPAVNIATGLSSTSISANGSYQIECAGFLAVVIEAQSAITGSALITLRTAAASSSSSGGSLSGNTLSGSIPSSQYPVDVGAIYQGGNPVSIPSGAISSLQVDSLGDLQVNDNTLGAGEDLTLNVLSIAKEFQYKMISTPTTAWLLKSGAGLLNNITIGNPVPSAVFQVFDNTSSSGPQIAQIGLPGVQGYGYNLEYGVAFSTGLCLSVPTACFASGPFNFTISYK